MRGRKCYAYTRTPRCGVGIEYRPLHRKDYTSLKNVGSGELVVVEADERPEVHGRKSLSILLTFSRKRVT